MKIFVVLLYLMLSFGVLGSTLLLSHGNTPFIVDMIFKIVALVWFVWFTCATSEMLYDIYRLSKGSQ